MQIGGNSKRGVKVGQYGDVGEPNGVIGWVEPSCDNPAWILWFTAKGDAILYTERGPDGAVTGEPIRVKAAK